MVARFFEKLRSNTPLLLFLLLGFLVRAFLTRYGNRGDLAVFAEWGQKFWELGANNFYLSEDWYYTFPTYPPLSSLMYAGLYWLFEHNYVLAQIHNVVKIIPADFIIYFNKIVAHSPFQYREGYFFLLKLPSILADLGISVVIYKLILNLTKVRKRAFIGFLVYLFNPVTIFLSSVWGQSESLVSFFGLLSFILLYYKKTWVSIPLFFVSLYLKPTWVVFIPLYLFLLYLYRPKLSHIVWGSGLALGLFLLTTFPFSEANVFSFTKETVLHNILPSAKGTARASISAFNFHTIFMKIDRSLATERFLRIPATTLGTLLYVFFNLFSFNYLRTRKKLLFPTIVSLFVIGFGSFLFLTNMLERYFFAAFAPMIVIMFVSVETLVYVALMNLVVFANLIWAFYRRWFDEIDVPFTSNNFLLIRVLSTINVLSFFVLIKRLNLRKGD